STANWRSTRLGGARGMSDHCMVRLLGSVKLELGEVPHPIDLIDFLGHLSLVEYEVLQDQGIHLGGEETSVGVLRRADDGFATDVEARVDEDRTTGDLVEGL